MKIVAFAQNQYREFPDDFQDRHEGTVTAPWSLAEPGEIRAAFRDYLDYIMQAARSGFDGVAFTEHAQTSYDMIANPSVIGGAIAYATETEGLDVAVYPVGRSLGKAREPVRVAEEYAMIDCISGGRLMAGFPVGLMFDAAINNGVPPIEVRHRYEENLRLILRAWRDPEPFAWNGRFTQLPSVNIWPRPLQQPLPVWITGVGNPATMKMALENNFGFNYFGWFGSELTASRVFARFREVADGVGIDANPNRLAFMASVCVGETDEAKPSGCTAPTSNISSTRGRARPRSASSPYRAGSRSPASASCWKTRRAISASRTRCGTRAPREFSRSARLSSDRPRRWRTG